MRRRTTLALGLTLALAAALTACSSDEAPQAAATTAAPTTAAAEPTGEPTPEATQEPAQTPAVALADALPVAADLGAGWVVVDAPAGEGLFGTELDDDATSAYAPAVCHTLSAQIEAFMLLASGAGEHADVLIGNADGAVVSVQLESVEGLDAAELTAFEESVAPCATYTFTQDGGTVIDHTAATVDSAGALADASTGIVATGGTGGSTTQLHLFVAHVGDVRVTTLALDADEATVLTAARTAIAHLQA